MAPAAAPLTPARPGAEGAYTYFGLACTFTWLCDVHVVLAAFRGVPPPAYGLAFAGLGAFGPSLAALLLAGPRRELSDVFGRWRVKPPWVVMALFTPLLLHLVATLIERALGGQPAQWFYLPLTAERIAALVLFSFGEEFGWRGYAQPRVVRRHGPVLGSLLLGSVWAVWHVPTLLAGSQGTLSPLGFGKAWLDFALYSILFTWLAERSGGSITVAIALHAGAHLDNVARAPGTEVRLQVLRLLVLCLAALLAARSLHLQGKR